MSQTDVDLKELTTELYGKLKAAGYKFLMKYDEGNDEMGNKEWYFRPLKANTEHYNVWSLNDIKFTSYIGGANEMGYYLIEVPIDI